MKKKKGQGDSLAVQWLGSGTFTAWAWVQSLGGELRSHKPYRMFSRIDHILSHKSNLNKFKRTEIISSIFSVQKSNKPEINHRNKNGGKKPHGD